MMSKGLMSKGLMSKGLMSKSLRRALIALLVTIIVVIILYVVLEVVVFKRAKNIAGGGVGGGVGGALPSGALPSGSQTTATTTTASEPLRLGNANVDCVVKWDLVSGCEPACSTKFATFSGTVITPPQGDGAPCPPLTKEEPCSFQNCPCLLSDLEGIISGSGLAPCDESECTNTPSGSGCSLKCASAQDTLYGSGFLSCVNGRWSLPLDSPTCKPTQAVCPPVLGDQSRTPIPGTYCIGARPGQQCGIWCGTGYILDGFASATCMPGGTWSNDLSCTCSSGCAGALARDNCAMGCR